MGIYNGIDQKIAQYKAQISYSRDLLNPHYLERQRELHLSEIAKHEGMLARLDHQADHAEEVIAETTFLLKQSEMLVRNKKRIKILLATAKELKKYEKFSR